MTNKITVELETPNGPVVRVLGDADHEEILAELPANWTIHDDDWNNGVCTDSGAWSYPLSRRYEDDEEREYEICDGNASWTITSRPSTIREDVAESVRDADWGDDCPTWWWHGNVTCDDGYDESHTVAIEPRVPPCRKGREHDWQSPHSVVGGIKENPGVWGKGGGVIITEVCAHCGRYRDTDTWAQDRSTGRQGLESVGYREADDDSLAWIQENDLGDDA